MIVCHIAGGLGNQLFNYAAARSLADRTKTKLIVDAAAFRGARPSRPFLLSEFPSIRAEIRNSSKALSVKRSLASRIRRKLEEDLLATKLRRPYEEVGYFEGFETLGRRVVLRGHFIDRRFFRWNETRIRDDLALSPEFLSCRRDVAGERLLERILSEAVSVSVHVRRGDFLAPHAQWLLLPRIDNYYLNAMNRMAKLIDKKIRFWIFSDDQPWCRDAFKDFPFDISFVDQFEDSETNPLRDFFLMSCCRHHIVANSSFSLWAAWLNQFQDKIVISPSIWDSEGRTQVDDLIPKKWIRMAW